MNWFGILVLGFLSVFTNGSPIDKVEKQLNDLNGKEITVERAIPINRWPSKFLLEYVGQVAGLSFCPNGYLFVFQRASRTFDDRSFDNNNKFTEISRGPIKESPILKVNNELEKPNVVGEYGAGIFYLPHGIYADSKYMWTTDLGLHQVIRIPHGKSKPDMTLGVPFTPGSDDKHFCKPTHVVTSQIDGSIFIADGYCNSRILKYDSSGKLLNKFANKGKHKVNIPHHLLLLESQDMLCVADRENRRMQCFNAGLKDAANTGRHIRTVSAPEFGPIYAIGHNSKSGLFYLVSGMDDSHTKSRVFMYNWEIDSLVGEIDYPGDYGFGLAHSLSVEPKGEFLAIGGLTKECRKDSLGCLLPGSDYSGDPMRNLWLYGLDSAKTKI